MQLSSFLDLLLSRCFAPSSSNGAFSHHHHAKHHASWTTVPSSMTPLPTSTSVAKCRAPSASAVCAFCALVLVAAMIGLLITTQSTIGRYLSVRGSRFFVAVCDFQHWVAHHVHNIFLKFKGSAQRMKGNINMAIASIWVGITRRKMEKEVAENQRQDKAQGA